MCGCWSHSTNRQICVNPYKAQGRLRKERWRECKNQKIGRSGTKLSLESGVALNSRVHYGRGCLLKTFMKSSQTNFQRERGGVHESPLLAETLLMLHDCLGVGVEGRGGRFSLGVKPVLSCPHCVSISTQWGETHVGDGHGKREELGWI